MSSKFEIVQGVIASPELYKARELCKTSTINENHYFLYDDLLSETVSPELYQARELWKARELLKTSTINENHYFLYNDLLIDISPDQTPPSSPRSVLEDPF